jgi:hypothetical protein
MKCIINAYSTNEVSKYNGLTFDIIGQSGNNFAVSIGESVNYVSNFELYIVDLENEFNAAVFRINAIGFDYWYNSIVSYMKRNKITLTPKEAIVLPEVIQEEQQTEQFETFIFEKSAFYSNEQHNTNSDVEIAPTGKESQKC